MTLTETITRQEPRVETLTFGKLRWINIEKPTVRETQYLAQHFPFHTLDLDDCLSRIQRPKVDAYDDYIFLVFHFPVWNKEARAIMATQISIFLGMDYLITLHEGNLKPMLKFFRDCSTNVNTRQDSMSHGAGYLLYLILDRLVNYCFPILYRIGNSIDSVEEKVFGENAREAVREISMLRRDVLSYRRIIRPQTQVLEWLEKSELPFLKEDPEVYFGDLADHNLKILDFLDEYKEVLEGLNDTNNTLTSFRISQVMRLLTVISVILLPLTLLASVYGMNITLPLQGTHVAFPILVATMILIVGGMLTFFRSRGWI